MSVPRDEAVIELLRERDRLRTIVANLAAAPEPRAFQSSFRDYCPLCHGEAPDADAPPAHTSSCPWRAAVAILAEHGARPR